MGSLAKDTTERDLWDFDQPENDDGLGPVEATREPDGSIPGPRNPDKPVLPRKPGATTTKSPDSQKQDRVQVNLGRNRARSEGSGSHVPASKAGEDFDDLDHWEDPLAGVEVQASPDPILSAVPAIEPGEPIVEAKAAAEIPVEPEAAAVPDAPAGEPKPASTASAKEAIPQLLGPFRHLSKIERIGLILLAGLLLFGAGAIFVISLKRLPVESTRVETADFPIAGEHLEITSAESYWRAPVEDGAAADTFRRGTVLLPVLSLGTGNGNAAIRVVFRNHDGEVIGDVVTRSVQGAQTLEIAATAGFDDAGMHAAYRTGESKPWTITVSEATSVNAPSGDFKPLFEMNISTVRR
jgi:hypothetical protein